MCIRDSSAPLRPPRNARKRHRFPRGSHRSWHQGDVSALLSAFTGPEERTEAQSVLGRAHQERNGAGTAGMYPPRSAPLQPPRNARKRHRFPRGPHRSWHQGDVPALLSAFAAPEERTEAQSLSARIRQDRIGDSTAGTVCASDKRPPRKRHRLIARYQPPVQLFNR